MPRVGAGAGDGLSTGAASALLGAQDAEYLREGTAPRRKAGQDPGAEDLLGRACCCRAAGLCALPLSLAVPLPGDGPPTGARSAGVVALLRLSTTPVAEAAHHQRDRTLFRRSPAPDPTHGGVHQRGKRGSDYLCDFQSLQRGLEKPHPPTIYTSSLTSPMAGQIIRKPHAWAEVLVVIARRLGHQRCRQRAERGSRLELLEGAAVGDVRSSDEIVILVPTEP